MDVSQVHEEVVEEYRSVTSGFVPLQDRLLSGLIDEPSPRTCSGLIRG